MLLQRITSFFPFILCSVPWAFKKENALERTKPPVDSLGMLAAAEGRLDEMAVTWADDHAMTVVMAAAGYPGAYEKGSVIKGLDALPETSHEMCFHAGTRRENGVVTAVGGRVLALTARGGRDPLITGLAVDSREVRDGFLFAAMPGTFNQASTQQHVVTRVRQFEYRVGAQVASLPESKAAAN